MDRLSVTPVVPTGREAVDDDATSTPETGPIPSEWGIGAMPAWLDPHAAAAIDRDTRDRGGHGGRRGRGRRADDFRLDDLDGGDDRFGEDDLDDDDDVGDRPIRRRFLMAPPAAIALIAIGVIACVVAGYGLLRDTSAAPTVNFPAVVGVPSTPSDVPPSSAVAGPPVSSARIVVSVVGLVYKPGLVRLAADARVADAIHSAGGPRRGADLLSLNLAQVVRDGDQILVGYAGEKGQTALRSAVVSGGGEGAGSAGGSPSAGAGPPGGGTSGGGAPGGGGSAGPAASTGKVNLNTATEAQLDELPGVGPVTAKAILAWRTANGRFSSVDQLAEVDGIGPARLAKLRDLVTV
ncbi:hypothetical protein GCM10009624_14590 [Gordonia sinesedis]